MKQKNKKLPASVLTAQELIGVDEISDHILYTKDKTMFAFIKVRAMGDSLLSNTEKESFYEKVTEALEKEKKAWQILSVPRVLNIQATVRHLYQLKRHTNNSVRLELLDGEIEFMREMARDGAKEPMILLKVWEQEGKHGEQDLEKRVSDLISGLRGARIEADRLENPDIAFLCKQFSDLDAPQSGGDDTGELPALENRPGYEPEIDLLNEITPMGGMAFQLKELRCGNTVGRVYAVSGYPRELRTGWATNIMNNTEAVTCITFDPANPHELAEALSKSIRRTAGEALSTKDVRESKTLTRKAKDADALLDDLDERGEIVGRMSVLTMPFSSKEEEYEEVCNRTVNLFSRHRVKLKSLGQLQREGFMAVSPYHTVPKIIGNSCGRLMPLYTLAGGSPMAINTYQDDGGFYFAQTDGGNLVNLNLWFRGGDRTNSNIILLGKAGMGKSTDVKHIIQIEYMRGTKILIVDPEREYPELTLFLGGSVFNAGGGDAKINVLQVRPSPDDDEEEENRDRLYDRSKKGNDLAMHLKNIDTFFRTYLADASEMAYSLLENACVELYRSFGITWDTDCREIADDKFPIISDLEALLRRKGEQSPDCADLAARLRSAASGSDQFIFNGHTNLDLSGQVLCFDTNRLQGAADKIKRAQYLNILSLCWELMSRDRNERVMLICDEAYLLVDPSLPQSLMYLRNIEKRCRKFRGSLCVVTHSVVDLLHPSIRQYGQAILDIPTYKFFLAADGQNLKELIVRPDRSAAKHPARREAEGGPRHARQHHAAPEVQTAAVQGGQYGEGRRRMTAKRTCFRRGALSMRRLNTCP